MTALSLPPLLAYPERPAEVTGALDRWGTAVAARLWAHRTQGRARRLRPVLAAMERFEAETRRLPDQALRMAARQAGAALRARPDMPPLAAARLLTPLAEAAHRVLGQRPYPTQVLAAYGCARGMMIEMATGEGKTLAASLAAAMVALTGTPVHVLTVNRYLAERDAAFAGPFYAFLGLESGLVTEAVKPPDRRAAYRCPITIAVNKDVAFDYMRDRLALGGGLQDGRRKLARLRGHGEEPLLRGLHYAIVDEADSVLIDEARTPLILAFNLPGEREQAVFDAALALAGSLRAGIDYHLLPGERRVVLTAPGRLNVGATCPGADASPVPPWDVPAERERLIEQALTAQHMMLRDEHYLVRGGRAEIIDEFTGRILPDRTWNDGLHELIERKENLDLSPLRETRARMTYQRFARRYRRLGGLSGTLHEVAGELWRVYGLRVARVPPNRPDRKTLNAPQGYQNGDRKWSAIAGRVHALHTAGHPVLIGTRTLADSDRASAELAARGLPHVVLNAAQDQAEAEVIAAAGRPGAITVATNMAGRGTDIRVDAGVADQGGLRVIVSEPHEARRIDRQLIGRCGRQGQPGEAVCHVALDDALVQRHARRWERMVARLLLGTTRGRSVVWAASRAQRRSERLHYGMRRDLLQADAWMEDAIAFAGPPE